MDDALQSDRASVISRLATQSGPGTGAGEAAAGAGFRPPDKYLVEGAIGRGGMGEVLLVTDRDLRRQVAMKVLLGGASAGEESQLHFVAEAQTTSQLEHPGIPPVHDMGVTADGRLYFTMKLVKGRTLREILHDLFVRRPEVQREWSLHRLTGAMERLCDALQFAHERGVIHRDLKPENMMLGDYGEVHLMDWGVARVRAPGAWEPGSEPAAADPVERVHTARTDAALETQQGALKGTLAYMAPEQLLGVAHERSDVFAAGLLLYEILTLQPAYDPRAPDLLARVAQVDVPDVALRNPRRPVPEALAQACRRAMAKDPAGRHASARELGQALRAWLDGSSERERRHGEAEAFAARGAAAVAAYDRARSEVAEAQAEVEAQAVRFRPWEPLEAKAPLLEARRRLRAGQREAGRAWTEALRWYDAALTQEERHPGARAALAGLWQERLRQAEREGDERGAEQALESVRHYDDGALAGFVKGDGTLSLTSIPAGAEVQIAPYADRDGVLVAGAPQRLGTTPLREVPVPMGSYLCTLRLSGFREVRYPVRVTRNRAWRGSVRLRTEAELGAGFVLVPGGPFVCGEGPGSREVELPEFAIARHPVTFGDYLAYVNLVEREQGPEAARAAAPGTPGDGDYLERDATGAWALRPGLLRPEVAARHHARHGTGCEARWPVFGVSHGQAVAYAAWRTAVTGVEHRLPSEEEREKAARGVDGRRYPWGDAAEASLCRCREARDEVPQPEPVGAFPSATSLYGMVDAAGSIQEWTSSWFDARRAERIARGGGWSNGIQHLRCAARLPLTPGERAGNLGFRLVRALPSA